jgi:hypothetical protein
LGIVRQLKPWKNGKPIDENLIWCVPCPPYNPVCMCVCPARHTILFLWLCLQAYPFVSHHQNAFLTISRLSCFTACTRTHTTTYAHRFTLHFVANAFVVGYGLKDTLHLLTHPLEAFDDSQGLTQVLCAYVFMYMFMYARVWVERPCTCERTRARARASGREGERTSERESL